MRFNHVPSFMSFLYFQNLVQDSYTSDELFIGVHKKTTQPSHFGAPCSVQTWPQPGINAFCWTTVSPWEKKTLWETRRRSWRVWCWALFSPYLEEDISMNQLFQSTTWVPGFWLHNHCVQHRTGVGKCPYYWGFVSHHLQLGSFRPKWESEAFDSSAKLDFEDDWLVVWLPFSIFPYIGNNE